MSKNAKPHVGLFKAFAVADEGTDAPSTLPALGANFAWADDEDWAEVDAYYADGDLGFEFEDDRVSISIPEVAKDLDLVSFRRGIKSITVPIAEFGETAWGLDAASSEDENDPIVTQGVTVTRKAVCLEIRGIALLYAPSCDIRVVGASGGVKTQTGLEIEITPLAYLDGSTVDENGFQVHRYNG